VIHFVNPDLIASGLSPVRPELAALAAGRLFLRELDRLARSRTDLAFEHTERADIRDVIEAVESRWLSDRNRVSAYRIAADRVPAYRCSGQTRRP